MHCAYRKTLGDCESKKTLMAKYCADTCNLCDYKPAGGGGGRSGGGGAVRGNSRGGSGGRSRYMPNRQGGRSGYNRREGGGGGYTLPRRLNSSGRLRRR